MKKIMNHKIYLIFNKKTQKTLETKIPETKTAENIFVVWYYKSGIRPRIIES